MERGHPASDAVSYHDGPPLRNCARLLHVASCAARRSAAADALATWSSTPAPQPLLPIPTLGRRIPILGSFWHQIRT
jgi:hypothetical protein